MLAVVVSRPDEASVAIGDQLRELSAWRTDRDDSRPEGEGGGRVYRRQGVAIREFDARHLDLVRPAHAFDDPELLVFASKHAGETGPLLTAHHTGNFGQADHGGSDRDLARACPNAHARVVAALRTHAPDGYRVGMEATHHGPSEVGVPSMFVEVGSGPDQWRDPAAATAVARAILAVRDVPPFRQPEYAVSKAGRSDCPREDQGSDASGDTKGSATGDPSTAPRGHQTADPPLRHVVGFGGGHYTPRFERLLRETDWAVGHVAPDWGLEAMGDPEDPAARGVIEQAFERSRARYALVEGDRAGVVEAAESLGYRVVSETWLREAAGVSLPLVEALEEAIAPVADGLRFGEAGPEAPGDFAIVSLPTDLLEAARSVDSTRVRAAVAERTLAFLTEDNGATVVGPAALPASSSRTALVGVLVEVLRAGYDEVEWTDDVVVARRERFDPERARTLGVPEGPAFGQLAAGETVEVDGREIDPRSVHTVHVDRFEV
ncbi:MAG: D-aminoacyl-tRNA deacylase [Haloarculaceae archaeon]